MDNKTKSVFQKYGMNYNKYTIIPQDLIPTVIPGEEEYDIFNPGHVLKFAQPVVIVGGGGGTGGSVIFPSDQKVHFDEAQEVKLLNAAGDAIATDASGNLIVTINEPSAPPISAINSKQFTIDTSPVVFADETALLATAGAVNCRLSVNNLTTAVVVTHDGSTPKGQYDPAGVFGELLLPGASLELTMTELNSLSIVSYDDAEDSSLFITIYGMAAG